MEVPPARFIQWRAVLRPGPPSAAIDSVALNYLPKNVAPVIEEVAAQVGARFQSTLKPATDNSPINVGGNVAPHPRFQVPTPALPDPSSVPLPPTPPAPNHTTLPP